MWGFVVSLHRRLFVEEGLQKGGYYGNAINT